MAWSEEMFELMRLMSILRDTSATVRGPYPNGPLVQPDDSLQNSVAPTGVVRVHNTDGRRATEGTNWNQRLSRRSAPAWDASLAVRTLRRGGWVCRRTSLSRNYLRAESVRPVGMTGSVSTRAWR